MAGTDMAASRVASNEESGAGSAGVEMTVRLPGGGAAAHAPRRIPRLTLAAAGPAAGHVRSRLAPLGAVTPTGWTVLIAALVAWYAAGRLHWPELGLIAVMGAVVFVLCCAMASGRTRLRVRVEPSAHRIDIGDEATVRVTVSDPADRRRLDLVPARLELPDGSPDGRSFELPLLARGASHEFDAFHVPGTKRGVIGIGPATAVRGDPFGLVRRTMALTGREELLVHPVRVPLLPLGSGLRHDLEGRITEHISASDLEFHTLREYQPSDDARHIHWRSSAKVSSARPDKSFMVRQFLETRLTHLLVLVDGDPASYGDTEQFETAISAGASIAVRAIQDKLQTTFLVADRVVHEPSVPQALDACSRAAMDPGSGISDLITRGLRVSPRTTSVMIVTGPVRDYPKLREVCRRIPRGLRAVAIRIDPATATGVTATGSLTALTLRRLGELPTLIREGAAG